MEQFVDLPFLEALGYLKAMGFLLFLLKLIARLDLTSMIFLIRTGNASTLRILVLQYNIVQRVRLFLGNQSILLSGIVAKLVKVQMFGHVVLDIKQALVTITYSEIVSTVTCIVCNGLKDHWREQMQQLVLLGVKCHTWEHQVIIKLELSQRSMPHLW